MKRNIFIAMMAILVIFATSCEKIGENKEKENNLNAKFEETGDPYDYVFVNPQWKLIDENYKDEYGNIGKYYININNKIERKFEIKVIEKDCGDGGSAFYEGKKETKGVKGSDEKLYYYTTCNRDLSPKDCRLKIYYDENMNPCKTEIEIISNCN